MIWHPAKAGCFFLGVRKEGRIGVWGLDSSQIFHKRVGNMCGFLEKLKKTIKM